MNNSPDDPTIEYTLVDPESLPAQEAMTHYFNEVNAAIGSNFDVADALVTGLDDMKPPTGAFVVALAGNGQVLGCGGVRALTQNTCEIKRMWVDPRARGTGVSTGLLEHLEGTCQAMGYSEIMLDTNTKLTPAVNLYERAGFTATAPFNDNPYADVWYVKKIA